MLKIDYCKKVTCPITEKFLNQIVEIFCKETKIKKGGFEVVVIGDKEMKRLNYTYRRKNKTTDVLSFSFLEDKKIKVDFLGQIFIAYPQIKRQAKQYKISEKEEFVRMLVHGLLHLVGYDHDTKMKEYKMFKLQESMVCKILNIK